MIKARPVAGDPAVGADMMKRLRPFIWRKYLDFAAIQDIQSIKRQIAAEPGGRPIEVAGHDIERGRGGIRQIELYAQTQQLIWGGRDPSLRFTRDVRRPQGACRSGTHERKSGAGADRLVSLPPQDRAPSWRWLTASRTCRSRAGADDRAAIARLMGFRNEADFTESLLAHVRSVEEHYAALFEDEPALGGEGGNLVFTGTADDPDTLASPPADGLRRCRRSLGDGASLAPWPDPGDPQHASAGTADRAHAGASSRTGPYRRPRLRVPQARRVPGGLAVGRSALFAAPRQSGPAHPAGRNSGQRTPHCRAPQPQSGPAGGSYQRRASPEFAGPAGAGRRSRSLPSSRRRQSVCAGRRATLAARTRIPGRNADPAGRCGRRQAVRRSFGHRRYGGRGVAPPGCNGNSQSGTARCRARHSRSSA